MKLMDIFESSNGTYAEVLFSNKTLKELESFIKDMKIPNPLHKSKLHSTLLFSRKVCDGYKARKNYDPVVIAKPKKFETWDINDNTKCLVLLIECDELIKRHKELRDTYGATHDYESYIPHITLSYDVGDFNITQLPKQIPIETIEIIGERQDDLIIN